MSFLEEAQARAQRRRSRWNALLIPAILVPGGVFMWGFMQVLQSLHQLRYPAQHLTNASGVGPVLTALGAFIASIPLAMLIGNYLVWFVGPARRTLEHEARGVPGTDFMSARRQLTRVALIVVPVALALGVAGAALSWGE